MRVCGQDRGAAARGLGLVLAVAVAYSAVHMLARLLASATLGEDDALETLIVQNLHSYPAPQPALYDWVLAGMQRVLGTGVGGFLLIKYSALIATAGFLYASARRVLGSPVWAMLAVEQLALIYQIGWRFHEGFTHQVLAMAATACLLWALVRAIEVPGYVGFAILGLTLGVGSMTTPAFLVAAACLLGAALLQPAIRNRLLRPGLAIAAVTALVAASPMVSALAAGAPGQWITPPAEGGLKTLGRGLVDAVRGPVFYLSPLIFILPVVFPGWITTAAGDLRRGPNASAEPDLAQLILHGAALGLAACVAGALVLRTGGYPMHAVMPLYLGALIWLMDVARRAAPAARYRRRFAVTAATIAAIALTARLANMVVHDPVCKQCRWGIPYAALAQALTAHGYDGTGTILSPAVDLAGNLRVYFPKAKIATPRWPLGIDRAKPHIETRALVWGDEPVEDVASVLRQLESGPAPDIGRATTVSVPWRHLWKPPGYRSTVWHFIVFEHRDPGKG